MQGLLIAGWCYSVGFALKELNGVILGERHFDVEYGLRLLRFFLRSRPLVWKCGRDFFLANWGQLVGGWTLLNFSKSNRKWSNCHLTIYISVSKRSIERIAWFFHTKLFCLNNIIPYFEAFNLTDPLWKFRLDPLYLHKSLVGRDRWLDVFFTSEDVSCSPFPGPQFDKSSSRAVTIAQDLNFSVDVSY